MAHAEATLYLRAVAVAVALLLALATLGSGSVVAGSVGQNGRPARLLRQYLFLRESESRRWGVGAARLALGFVGAVEQGAGRAGPLLVDDVALAPGCLLYTSPSPRDS